MMIFIILVIDIIDDDSKMMMMMLNMNFMMVLNEHTVYILLIVKNKWCIILIEMLGYPHYNHYYQHLQ